MFLKHGWWHQSGTVHAANSALQDNVSYRRQLWYRTIIGVGFASPGICEGIYKSFAKGSDQVGTDEPEC
ncbi:MAG: hypothetical protein U9N43_01545 [Euryarchaeota archaeon]|nr:hypothetical protein [Euryarchaeota archaeon]